MGLTLSMLRIDFYLYRLIARNVTIPSREITLLREKFCDQPGSMLDKLKVLRSEVFSVVHWGRLVVFLNFAEKLGLTEEEWEQLFHFLVPKSSNIIEHRGQKGYSSVDLCRIRSVMGCCVLSPSFGFERIFNCIRCVLACCGGKVIVPNSEFCDGENNVEHISRSKSSRKFQWCGCCVPRAQRAGKK